MSFLIQHGFGKSGKIHSAFDGKFADGVIFSPRNEKRTKLEACVESLRENYDQIELLFDPQFYLSCFDPAKDGYLSEYSYYQPNLSPSSFAKPSTVAKITKKVIEVQAEFQFDAILSPTVMFDSFDDVMYQAALTMAYASLDAHSGLKTSQPLLLSFAFNEDVLVSQKGVEVFLDTVTQQDWGMAGFYFVIARSEDGYSQRFDQERLANLLYLTHVLGVTNQLRVVFGYTDFLGLPLRAVGADAFASGWAQSLRRFQKKAWIKQKGGGQPPRERYSSSKLYNSIFLTELQDIFDAGELDAVLSEVELDNRITQALSPLAADWGREVSQLHHWQTLHALDATIRGKPKELTRKLIKALREADGLYTALEAQGVQFDKLTDGQHLVPWVKALRRFQQLIGWTD